MFRIETGDDAPLARPLQWNGHTVGNRFCILPMEGWDGLRDGRPSPSATRIPPGGSRPRSCVQRAGERPDSSRNVKSAFAPSSAVDHVESGTV